jgi:hypothetical protein
MLFLTLMTFQSCLNSASLRIKESLMEIQKRSVTSKKVGSTVPIVTSEMNATSGGVLFYIRETTNNTALNYTITMIPVTRQTVI